MNPMFQAMNYGTGLLRLQAAIARMTMAASEVVWRRTMMMAQGDMSAPEAARMWMEKPAAFADAAQRATVAASRGADATTIAEAALRPYGARARANARRLSR